MPPLSEREKLEREKLRAETMAYQFEQEKLAAEAELYRNQVGIERRRELVVLSRTVYLSGDVEDVEIERAVEELRDLRAEATGPITLYLNSPGGDVFLGWMLFDLLREISNSGCRIETRVMGLAASMGSILSQAGDRRLISRNSWFMVHEPHTIMWGRAGDIKREAKLMEQLHDQQCRLFAERSTLTFAEIKRRSQDKDWWLPAAEALEHKFFDGVAE